MGKTSVKESSDAELLSALTDVKEEMFKMRFQHATGQLEDTSKMSSLKKQVARIHTEIRSREIIAAEAIENAEGES